MFRQNSFKIDNILNIQSQLLSYSENLHWLLLHSSEDTEQYNAGISVTRMLDKK